MQAELGAGPNRALSKPVNKQPLSSDSRFRVYPFSLFIVNHGSSSEVPRPSPVLLLALEVLEVELGLVEPGLLGGEDGGQAGIVLQVDPVAAVVDVERRVPRIANLGASGAETRSIFEK